jgi:DNA-binding transcriptional regulator YdaS (Cro superfamily)
MRKPSPKTSPFALAVERAEGLNNLALRIGVKPSRAGNWYVRGVPAQFCIDIERETGISRHALRPDVFGKGDHAQQPRAANDD